MLKRFSFAILILITPLLSCVATATDSGCTVSYEGNTVDGKTLWAAVPRGENAVDCEFHQLGWNNFLYLVNKDSSGHPRFMSYAPWYDALPSEGAPTWPGGYAPLSGIQLKKAENEVQTGDSFWLMDVAQGVTAYDMRVNERFFNAIVSQGVYTKTGMSAAVKAYNKDPSTGGIWLPPVDFSDKKLGAIEIKTSWRDYGPQEGACPSDVMHCETDTKGNHWGLVGMLVAQKISGHGEFIWTVFEHVANVPDCVSGQSSPIAQNPTDPVTGGTLNVNSGDVAKETGWNYFNYASYKTGGGDGSSCGFPNGTYTYDKATKKDSCGAPSTSPLCNTDPRASGGGFQQVNICRTDPLPPPADSCTGPDNTKPAQSSRNVSCLNQSVLDNFPSGLDAKWKYYKMIGTEWMYDGASNFGAPLQGCFEFASINSNPIFASTCKDGTAENQTTRRGNPNLASSTSETWLQKGMCLPDSTTGSVVAVALDCFSCHQPATKSFQGDMSHLFGRVTQSGSKQRLLQMRPAH